MKHTSVRLSKRHLEKIKATGKPASEVVRAALDHYFEIKPEGHLIEDVKALIREHEKRCHVGAHIESTPKPPAESVRVDVRDVRAQRALDVPQDVRAILQVITDFHDRGEEPTAGDVAEKVGVPSRSLGKVLGKYGIQTAKVQRNNRQGRYYTFELRERIEELIAMGEQEK